LSRHKAGRLFQKFKGAYRIPRRVVRFEKLFANGSPQTVFHHCFSGYRSMKTTLALSAIIAALMLTACAKQEAAAPAAEPAAPPAAEAPPADAAPAPDAAATPPAEGAATPPADGAAPPAEPPKQ
jgi:hypothetical protein